MKSNTHNGWRIVLFVIAVALLSSFTYATNTGTMIYFNILDHDAPTVTLDAPSDDHNSSSDSMTFNWTAYDETDTTLTCNITMNGIVRANNIQALNSTMTSANIGGLTSGVYYWNITCWDDNNNRNTSETRNMTLNITLPPPGPSGGGGGNRGELHLTEEGCEEVWLCTAWTSCTNNMQSRSCYESKGCGTADNIPTRQQTCMASKEAQENITESMTESMTDSMTEGADISAYDIRDSSGSSLTLLDTEIMNRIQTDDAETGSGRDLITGEAIARHPYTRPNQIYALPTALLLALLVALILSSLDRPKWKRRHRTKQRNKNHKEHCRKQ